MLPGPVHKDEVEDLQTSEDVPVTVDTNFTSGLHFYEQVNHLDYYHTC